MQIFPFDKLLLKHIGHVGSNAYRSQFLACLTCGINEPYANRRRHEALLPASEPTERKPRAAVRSSIMAVLGGSLKRRERISARLLRCVESALSARPQPY